MDPASRGDPIVLLAELIDLLRGIKDSGNTELAAAAIGAVQHIAARSKAGADSIFPAAPTLPSSSPNSLVDFSDVSSTADGPPPPADLPMHCSEAPVAEPLTSSETDAIPPSDLASSTLTDAPIPATADTRPLSHDSPPAVQLPSIPLPPRVEDVAEEPVSPPVQAPPRTAPAHASAKPQAPRAAEGAKPGASAQPETTPHKPRNLIVCIDGTSNQFSQKNTNVVELYHRLIKDDEQLTFYNSGIGTYATPSWKSLKYLMQVLKNKIDLAIAWNLESILLSAYLWLSENYRKGDRIYLFGFSRGAYQVRALSAMIESVGLLYKGNQDQIPFAFQLYAETKHFERIDAMRQRFKETFSWTVTVELVAVWDTVSSVGLFRDKILPGTTDGMKHVKYFRHALALHERRIKFLPENAREGAGPREEDTKATDGARPHTKEVWFAGSHSNIGGGAMPNEDMKTFGPALRWMTFEATLAGVRLRDAPEQWKDIVISKSLTTGWKLFEGIPFGRLTYRSEKGLTHRWHLGRPRKIQEHQLIHETAFGLIHEALDGTSRWRARLPGSLQWDRKALEAQGLVEADPYTAASRYLEVMKQPGFSSLSSDEILGLRTLISTDIGQSSLGDVPNAAEILSQAIYQILTCESTTTLEDVHAVLDILILVMEQCWFQYVHSPMPEARAHAARVAFEDEQLARKIVEFCDSAMVGDPLEHPENVNCVAYMPDGDRIVSGCRDGAVRIWNIETRQIVGAPMTRHTHWVFCVAVSADGTKIASGSADKTIRVWSVESGAMVALLAGHDGSVLSIAFSPDGMRVVSGSNARTMRVWDVASAKTVVGPIQGQSFLLRSVVFSPDGSRISAADGFTVSVLNAETGEELWQTEMSSYVLSVAYSPDGKRIVAGRRDGTVHVLDAETGDIVPGPLTGNTDFVRSVAFSPDGKKIASGSEDGTIRLWDAETGHALDVLRGYRNKVISVAFSPDGKHVASASMDRTVRIWDATGERMRW